MNNISKSALSLLCIPILMLPGCQKSTEPGGILRDDVIRFSPSVANNTIATKGTLINTSGSDEALSTAASSLTEFYISAWDNASAPLNIIPSWSKVVSRNSGAYWITVDGEGKDQEYLWRQGETKTFFAYANLPSSYATAACALDGTAPTQTLTIASLPPVSTSQEDILLGYYTNGATPKSNGLIPITFYHPMTAVIFKMDTGFPGGVNIESVQIEGVYESGTATMDATSMAEIENSAKFVWSACSGSQTVSLSSVTVDSDNQIGDALILIPQSFDGSSTSRIKVVLNDGTDNLALYYPLAGTTWRAGYIKTYEIKFNGGGYTVEEPDEYNGSSL